MRLQRIFFVLLLAVMCPELSLWAEEHSETIRTQQGDQIVLCYDIEHKNNQVIISLTRNPVITLGPQHRGAYGDSYRDNKIKCLYFETNKEKYGGKKQKPDFNGLQPSAMRITNADLRSSDYNGFGYVELEQNKQIVLTLGDGNSPRVSIPVYLTEYKGKNKLKLIDVSTIPLSIDLTKPAPKPKVRQQQPNPNPVNTDKGSGVEVRREAVYEEQYIPASQEELTDVGDTGGVGGGVFSIQQQIDRARNILARQEGEQISDDLNKVLDDLAAMSSTCSPEEKAAIEKLKADVQQKKAELKQAAKDAKDAEKEKQEEEDAKQKKRNIWMIIGGALLAVLLFVGNQVMQHLRNRSQVRSMQELQDRAMHQAEGQIKQRTRSMVQQQMGKGEQAVVRTASGSLRAVRGSAGDHGRSKSADALSGGTGQATGTPSGVKGQGTGSATKGKPKDRSKETLQEKAERAARGARIRKHRDADGNLSI